MQKQSLLTKNIGNIGRKDYYNGQRICVVWEEQDSKLQFVMNTCIFLPNQKFSWEH